MIPEEKTLDSFDSALNHIKRIKNDYKKNESLWDFINGVFLFLIEKKVEFSNFRNIDFEIDEFLFNDVFGTILQKSYDFNYRKTIAANYTTIASTKVICSLLPHKKFKKIIDPFCGSGRLITTYLGEIIDQTSFPEEIWINDLVASAVLIAYARLLLMLKNSNQDPKKVIATIGDAFKRIPINTLIKTEITFDSDFDLVIMNPPFTRTHRIDDNQRKILFPLINRYKRFLIGQPGLHIYSILLADLLLSNNGVLSAILPASTFLSNYSKGIQKLFTSKYEINSLLTSDNAKSFSEDSDLREIVLTSIKSVSDPNHKIKFVLITEKRTKYMWELVFSRLVPLKRLKNDWNWMRYFQNKKILDIRRKLLKTRKVKTGKELNLKIVRGVEMYGPDFFFLPNKTWKKVEREENSYLLSSDDKQINLPDIYLINALRKPSNYIGYITPEVDDYALSIPENSNQHSKSIKTYLEITKSFAMPARKKYKDKWVNHIFNQLEVKKPWGYLFFVDKFGITSATNNILFFDNKITSSKNFYVLTNRNYKESKFLGAWLNSSFYYLLFISSRREIGGSYGRLQIADYMKEKIFLDISLCSQDRVKLVLEAFDDFRSGKLESIPDQINQTNRKNLDIAIARAIGFPEDDILNLIELLYRTLKESFDKMKIRDSSRSTRLN